MNALARCCILFLLGLTSAAGSDEFIRRILREEPDHLCNPLKNVSESSSLIDVRTYERTLLTLSKQDSGSYLLRAQRIDHARIVRGIMQNQKSINNFGNWQIQLPPPRIIGTANEYPYEVAQIEISEDIAKELTHLWLHELQRVPTDDKVWIGLCGMSWFFSASLPEGGRATAFIWSPRREAPPLWLVRASDSLIDYVFDPSNHIHLQNFRKNADLILRYGEALKEHTQDSAGQPATAPESKSKGKDKPQPESKSAPR